MTVYAVTFIYDYTIIRTTVETTTKNEDAIVMLANDVIREDIGFAALAHCNDYEIEEV